MSRLRDLVESGHTLDKSTILAMLDMVDRLEQAEAQVARVRNLLERWDHLLNIMQTFPGASMTPLQDVISDLNGALEGGKQ